MTQQTSYVEMLVITVDAKTTGATTIAATDAFRRFYPIFAVFEVVVGSVILSVPTLSIGTNASSYNDIIPATAMTGLTSTNQTLNTGMLFTTATSSVAPATTIKVNVTIGATATTDNLKVMLFGIYD